jgi:hypothetical protein
MPFALLLALALTAMSPTPSDSVDVRLDEHRWEHRPLVVFAGEGHSDALEAQEEALAGTDEGFRDRDMLLITVRAEGTSRIRRAPSGDARPLTDAAVRRLQERFDVPSDAFRVILVGKDGTEKRRETEPVAARVLFDQIDAMPMRQREMREDGGE